MTEPLDLLAIGAHPDDVEMTSGGWLALAHEQGHRTGVLHLTRGEMGTHGTPEQREIEARAAADLLGCSAIEFAGLPDGHLRDDDDSIATVARHLRQLRPRVVIAPYFVCHHPDHEAAARIAVRAVHLASLRGYDDGLPRHTTQRLVHARYSQQFEPSFYVDVSSVVEKKRQSILAYRSQVTDSVDPNDEIPVTRLARPGFTDQVLARNAADGLKAACDYAEAYWMRTGFILKDPIRTLGEGPAQHLVR
ncbi:MAG: bacillithiol biosynthesis deacetylase BshB1 [Planctomycetes bacterium]|nr:bacillithiol biosynthesis deacetylase BshB1 [Planctomycetota bacterium]